MTGVLILAVFCYLVAGLATANVTMWDRPPLHRRAEWWTAFILWPAVWILWTVTWMFRRSEL